MPPTTTCNPGDVVLVRFPFTDLTSTKQRPAVVVSPAAFPARYGGCALMPLASQLQPDPKLALTHWRAAGLIKPTWVKPVISTPSLALIIKVLGQLDPRDDSAVRVGRAEVIDGRF